MNEKKTRICPHCRHKSKPKMKLVWKVAAILMTVYTFLQVFGLIFAVPLMLAEGQNALALWCMLWSIVAGLITIGMVVIPDRICPKCDSDYNIKI